MAVESGAMIILLSPPSPKPLPPEGAKTNPSKRHRDRLNQELSRLTNLLPFPEDVRARLDKLSVLRLIVGYLKVKDYFAGKWWLLLQSEGERPPGTCWDPGGGCGHKRKRATLKDNNASCSVDPPMNPGRSEQTFPQINVDLFSEGDLLLQALNGFLMAVTEDGYIFYVSPTVQDYLGFHQSDVIYQSVFELIHKEDRAMFQSQLHLSPLPGESSLPLSGTPPASIQHLPLEDPSYLERSFVCRFRCLLDNSSGFLELNFQGHLKFLPGQNTKSEDGTFLTPHLTLFATATPRQPLTILELQNKTFIFQTKHKLDFTPIACDSRGKVMLGYTASELCRRGSGYQFIHAADMMYCAENHVRMMRTGESGLTVFRLLTKQGRWLWVQSNARLVFRGGRPECIVARQRALTNLEGEEHLRKRALQLPFTFTTGEAILYESSLPSALTALPARKRTRVRKGLPAGQDSSCPGSLLGAMMQQNESMYLSCIAPTLQGSPLERQGSDNRCEDKEEKEKEEGSSLLALIETLLEKDREEQPDLCSTLQHLAVTNLNQSLWEEKLQGVDLGPAGPQNCHLPPPSQGRKLHREETQFYDTGNVGLPPPASMTSPQTLNPPSSQGSAQLATEVTPPPNVGLVPSYPQAQPQDCLITRPSVPGPTLQNPLQGPPQWWPRHSQAVPSNLEMCQKPTFDLSPLPQASSPSRPAQGFQPSHTPFLSLGENVPGHLVPPGPGVLNFCKESMPWTSTHSGQGQGSLIPSDPTLCVNPCGTHRLGSIWDSPIQDHPVAVPMEVVAEQKAGQAQPNPFSCPWMVDSCLPWTRPPSPSLYRDPNPATKQQQWVQGVLQSQEHCGQSGDTDFAKVAGYCHVGHVKPVVVAATAPWRAPFGVSWAIAEQPGCSP
ncbi:PREDICTED: aryl hydrocarbon receptor-like [Colobus angolensis palliatus]|uniref:aryl hydrocarbon receptor-like n=1 Tax=Colobus angolensis palliatus TaxID=336983 RepID=UPI0005F55CF4|nr:PREDICTED: aryl hydrocarbon receptor-like [Colobus angolensis palliatus]